jgi:hypothetical protein
MAILTTEQITDIVKNNPNKSLIQSAQEYSKKLQLHVLGRGISEALSRNSYFENEDVFACRNEKVTSNKDLFSRLLHREEMVFTAKGGASYYKGLSEAQTLQMDAKLDTIRFGMNIRKWIKEFALKAYRTDPMGVLFVEVGNTAYPTYKSIDCVFDYLPNGRKLEYVVFRLFPSEAKAMLQAVGSDTSSPDLAVNTGKYSNYYRVVDDARDYIVKNTGTAIEFLHDMPIAFDELPGIRASDVIDFNNPINLLSPLDNTVELADRYVEDRSIRDLSKKYTGFPKGYEPILSCSRCAGTGMLSGAACPECTPVGATKGTGIKLRTKVADIARFPLPAAGQQGGITDPSKFFGYVERDISAWDKQDTSLQDIETTINDTYWGTTSTASTTGPQIGAKHSFQETATKTLADLQPIYARLNATADWAESTENALCNWIGEYNFKGSFQESSRTYGRYYILETPDELIEEYLDMKTKGASQTVLYDTLRKYYHSIYANDPIKLAICLKLVNVEPFIHQTLTEVSGGNPSRIDFYTKMYYGDWLATKDDSYLLVTKVEALKIDLTSFATLKMVEPTESLTPPTTSISLTERKQ